jgi:hypothetical protein
MAWVNADAEPQGQVRRHHDPAGAGYAERAKFEKASVYMQEAPFGSEVVILGFRMFGLKMQLATDPKDAAKVALRWPVCKPRGRLLEGLQPATDQK